MTASRLAELCGLTTGAITGVLDRLERAHLVRREADPADRRRTLVRGPARPRGRVPRGVYGPSRRPSWSRGDEPRRAPQRASARSSRGASGAFERETARLRAQHPGRHRGRDVHRAAGRRSMRAAWCSPRVRRGCRCARRRWARPTDARMVAQLARSSLRLTTGARAGRAVPGHVHGSRAGHQGEPRRQVAVRYRSRLDWRARQAEPRPEPGGALDDRHRWRAVRAVGRPARPAAAVAGREGRAWTSWSWTCPTRTAPAASASRAPPPT